nr:receptor-interacting serine/threonine-protein kinase 1 isoform X2 [Ciona intestinalis]XP_026696162.1 receptor-interacting serine/threonine-protein kinase 1 isoform X2 [Ciona intestinalis]|eukprot:XP_026696161.1 receptor-interacting serine/threonine-protein kinase 1 isoform X2 [Ciona intestinalis]
MEARDDYNVDSSLKEVGIFLKADHPNIVRVYGITSWVGSFGIIMEYMERGNLSVLIESARTHKYQIPFNLLVRILLQVANGVAFLHKIGEDQQIVHGDLKPSNIVLKDDFTAKVADFGGATLRTYTKTGEITSRDAENTVHTPLYTAPERLKDLYLPATKASDVYSYGMIIYECLSDASACRLKFDKNVSLRRVIINEKFKLPRDRIEKKKKDCGEQLPSLLCLEQCMEKCRQFNKENRQTMIVTRNQLQLHFDKVAQKNVLNSIAEVSSNLGSCTKTPASSSQLICLKHLSPPSFRPSHVPPHVSVNKEFVETKPLIKSSSLIVETTLFQEGETKPLMALPPTTNNSVLDEKILPLIKGAETAVISGPNPETVLQALNNALEEKGELGTVESTRLVYELHLLCQKFNETESLAARELVRHCVKRCLGIEDKNVRKGYHDSFLEKL